MEGKEVHPGRCLGKGFVVFNWRLREAGMERQQEGWLDTRGVESLAWEGQMLLRGGGLRAGKVGVRVPRSLCV